MSFPDSAERWWPFRWSAIETLRSLSRRSRPKFSPTSKLWVLEVNFKLNPDSEAGQSIAVQREYLLEKYGIDLLVMEPGYRLKRFDEF